MTVPGKINQSIFATMNNQSNRTPNAQSEEKTLGISPRTTNLFPSLQNAIVALRLKIVISTHPTLLLSSSLSLFSLIIDS